MQPQEKLSLLTEEEYLALEQQSETRHEYVAGYLFAMAGSSKRHNRIAINLLMLLRQHLSNTPCEVFMSDVKVYVKKAQAFYYPDLLVSCDPTDNTQEYYATSPCLIVEVLSPSTKMIDKREKWLHYQQLESLQEYVLIEQELIHVQKYQRDQEGNWWLEDLSQGMTLSLRCIAAQFLVDDLYTNVFS
jgi:Uma2 family endonuclease